MMSRARIRPATAGFSLLEVLVASAVLAIVLMVLLGVLTTTLNLWSATESKLQADREGRSAMLFLAQDLSSVVVPQNTRLWPRVEDDHLQFLTLKSPDDQPESEDVGDLCFVEYYVDPASKSLRRNFIGSRATFEQILVPGGFPNPTTDEGLLVADNVLENARDAVRGTMLGQLMINDNFIMLNTNLTRFFGQYQNDPSGTNIPAAIEVNIAVADSTSMDPANQAIWRNNPSIILRDAGIYTFRVQLPSPPATP